MMRATMAVAAPVGLLAPACGISAYCETDPDCPFGMICKRGKCRCPEPGEKPQPGAEFGEPCKATKHSVAGLECRGENGRTTLGNNRPVARAEASPVGASVGQKVWLSGRKSYDQDMDAPITFTA